MRNWLLCSTLLLGLAACSAPETTDDGITADEGENTVEDSQMAETEETARDDGVDEDTAALPETDIAIATISWTNGLPEISAPVVVTGRGLYDNQPAYDADGGFFFTTESPDGNTDIRYMDRSGSVSVITNTPGESEYSPRPSPDGRSVTYIHQPPGQVGGQAWRLMLDGSNYGPIHEYGPAGYYALSGDQTQMLLFALTDPFSLLWTDLELGIEEEITTGLGRALYTAPDGQSAFFTLEHPEGGFIVNRFSFADASITPVFRLPGESQDYAVFTNPDGGLGWLSATSDTLFYRDDSVSSWQPIADLDAMGLSGVTRLAVSPSADRLAVVSNE